MNGLRYALSVSTLVALAGGYAGSQWSFFHGAPWTVGGWVKWVALGVLAGAVLLAIVPAEGPEG